MFENYYFADFEESKLWVEFCIALELEQTQTWWE